MGSCPVDRLDNFNHFLNAFLSIPDIQTDIFMDACKLFLECPELKERGYKYFFACRNKLK